MKLLGKALLVAAAIGIGRYFLGDVQGPVDAPAAQGIDGIPDSRSSEYANFACDGRAYCSQMTSCEEATFFLQNCPGVKMDGNNDGVPCEQQWCGQ